MHVNKFRKKKSKRILSYLFTLTIKLWVGILLYKHFKLGHNNNALACFRCRTFHVSNLMQMNYTLVLARLH